MVDEKTSTFCGTLEYMAPEIFAGFNYSFPVDYWSFGILIFEMLYSMRPFQSKNELELERFITEDPVIFPRQITGKEVPDQLKSLICSLLKKSQNERLQSFEDIQRHPTFCNFDWLALKEKRLQPSLLPDASSPTINFDPEYAKFEASLESVTTEINRNIATALEGFDEVIQ